MSTISTPGMLDDARRIAAHLSQPAASSHHPTIWGLRPAELHDHYWAARGVFVVRPGQTAEIPDEAELYLLTDSHTLAIFRLGDIVETLSWIKPTILFVRLEDRSDLGYRETAVADRNGRFVRFKRMYGGATGRVVRVAMTKDRELAAFWQSSSGAPSKSSSSVTSHAWRQLRRKARRGSRETVSEPGRAYDSHCDEDSARLVSDLVQHWREPCRTLPIKQVAPQVWAHRDVKLDPTVQIIGPAWVGAGRNVSPGRTILGPAALWDDPASRPAVGHRDWSELEPTEPLSPAVTRAILRKGHFSLYRISKRIIDTVAAAFALLLTLPFYPLVMFAIWREDGRPFFFVHWRETIDGREFPLIKFRSMRKDAEKLKNTLKQVNLADGPQFYMPSDPRITKVGNLLRRCNIDEMPQFINVLLGHMSIVGPRPSPFKENQCCPAWREARLSVRPGITGLWQVMRTRAEGMDFQEWIRWDLEYVQKAGWLLDARIIAKTFKILLKNA